MYYLVAKVCAGAVGVMLGEFTLPPSTCREMVMPRLYETMAECNLDLVAANVSLQVAQDKLGYLGLTFLFPTCEQRRGEQEL